MRSPSVRLILTTLTAAVTLAVSSCLPQSGNDDEHPVSRKIVKTGQNDAATSTPPPPSPEQVKPPVEDQDTSCVKSDAFSCKVERIITEKTNKYRASRGLQPLTHDAKLSFVARDWSSKQASSGSISHRGFPSARVSLYREEFKSSRNIDGENVAWTSGIRGSSSKDDAAAEAIAQEFAVMWWNSAGHRANMLGRHSSIGVGVFQKSSGAWYATQLFD